MAQNDDDSTLLEACAAGSLARVRAALARGEDPNQRGSSGETPLHLACRSTAISPADRPEIVRSLLAAGAGPFARDDRGAPIASDELKTRLLLSYARQDEHPRPLVLYRGDEHPLWSYMLRFAPEAEAVGQRTHWTELEPARRPLGPATDGRVSANPCSLFAETGPEVPRGMDVSFQLGEAFASHDALRAELLGREEEFGANYRLVYGYHADASFDQCWRALPRHRPVLRFDDLRRRFASYARNAPEQTARAVRAHAEQAEYDPRAGTWVLTDADAFARGERCPPIVSSDEQRLLCSHFEALDPLRWNELDHALARALLEGGALTQLDSALDASDVSVDRHAHFRAWARGCGASEDALLDAAVHSSRLMQRWTGREAWIATASVEALARAVLDDRAPPPALARVSVLLARWLCKLPVAEQKARQLWDLVRDRAREPAVLAMLDRDAARFSPWIAPWADRWSDAVRSRLALAR